MVTSRALERKVRSKSPPRLRPWAFSDGPRVEEESNSLPNTLNFSGKRYA